MASWVGLGVALFLSSSAATAAGQGTGARVELRWTAPASCPDALSLIRQIEEFLGQPLAEAREHELVIDARVQGDVSHGFAGKLSFAGNQGSSERVIEHPDCTKLTEAMALLAAIAIDPERVRARQQAQSSPAAPELPAEAAGPPAAATPVIARPQPVAPIVSRRPERQAAPARHLRPHVGLFALVGGGMLPSATPGLGLELGASIGWLEGAVLGRTWASRSADLPQAGDASVGMSLTTAGLRLCGVPSRGAWSLRLCARADLGRMSGLGEHVDNARSRRDWFGGLGGSLGVAYQVGRLTPTLGAELLGSPYRPRFGVLRGGEGILAFRPEAWQGAGFLGLAYQL